VVDFSDWCYFTFQSFIWADLQPDVFNNNTVIYRNYSKRRYWSTEEICLWLSDLSELQLTGKLSMYVVNKTSTMHCIY